MIEINFGKKLKKYRSLKGLTQKELGLMIGFSNATADSRIRKYEKNLMAPKADIKEKLVNSLEIDPAALSYTEINSTEELIYLFLLLEDYGLAPYEIDGKIYLSFNDTTDLNREINDYLKRWYNKREEINLPQSKEYELFKTRFFKEINDVVENSTIRFYNPE